MALSYLFGPQRVKNFYIFFKKFAIFFKHNLSKKLTNFLKKRVNIFQKFLSRFLFKKVELILESGLILERGLIFFKPPQRGGGGYFREGTYFRENTVVYLC